MAARIARPVASPPPPGGIIVPAIREEIARQGLSVRALAERVGLSYKRVWVALNRGSMPTATADILISALDLDIRPRRRSRRPRRRQTGDDGISRPRPIRTRRVVNMVG